MKLLSLCALFALCASTATADKKEAAVEAEEAETSAYFIPPGGYGKPVCETTRFDKCLYSTHSAGKVKIGDLAKHHLTYNQKQNQLTIKRLAVRVKTPPACSGSKLDTRVNFYEVSNCRGDCNPKIVCSNTRLTEKGGFKWTNKNFAAWQTKTSFGWTHLGAVLDLNTIKDGACDCHAKINVNFCVRFEVRLHGFVLWVDEAKFKVEVHIETEGEERGEISIPFYPEPYPVVVPTYKATVIATTTVISKPLIFFCEETSTGWQRKTDCNGKVEQNRAFALCIVGDTLGSTITKIHSLSLGVEQSCKLCLNTRNGGDRCAWDTRDGFNDQLRTNQVHLLRPSNDCDIGSVGVSTPFVRTHIGLTGHKIQTKAGCYGGCKSTLRQGFVVNVRMGEHFFAGCEMTATVSATVKSKTDVTAKLDGSVRTEVTILEVERLAARIFKWSGTWVERTIKIAYHQSTDLVYDVIHG